MELLAEVRQLRAAPAMRGGDRLFSDVWAAYAKTWAREDWATNVRDLMKHVLIHFATLPMAAVTLEEWERYVDARLATTTNRGRAPAPSSLNTELRRMKAFLRWAIRRGHIEHCAVVHAKPLAARPHRTTEIHDDALPRLLAELEPLMRALVLVAIDTGMRATEVRTLTWRQIDLKRGRVTCYWWRAKTKRPRSTRLTERAADALKAIKPPTGGSEYVFVNPATGLPYSTTWVWDRWRTATAEAGLQPDDPEDENVHLHDARHTFMSQAVRRGVPLAVAMRLSGHRSLSSAGKYLHVNEDDLDEAKRTLDEAIRRGPRRAEESADHPLNERVGDGTAE